MATKNACPWQIIQIQVKPFLIHPSAVLCGRHGRIVRFAWLAWCIVLRMEGNTLINLSAIFGNPTISLKISWICPFVNWIRRLLQRDFRTYCVQSLSRGPIVCLACFDVGDTGDRQSGMGEIWSPSKSVAVLSLPFRLWMLERWDVRGRNPESFI